MGLRVYLVSDIKGIWYFVYGGYIFFCLLVVYIDYIIKWNLIFGK